MYTCALLEKGPIIITKFPQDSVTPYSGLKMATNSTADFLLRNTFKSLSLKPE
jgi:hypothetical protein